MASKRKSKKAGLFCYISMTDEELYLMYGPEYEGSFEEALRDFDKDCIDIAKHNGYKEYQIFQTGLDEYRKRIKWFWEHKEEIINGPDIEERAGSDS